MSKVVVFTNLTLDGVMQAPGRPDEDCRGGFEHGGWATPYAAMAQAGGSISYTGALLLSDGFSTTGVPSLGSSARDTGY